MAGPGRLQDLDLSAEEAERLQRAFRDEQFRALFAEYAAELTDPEQRRLYEEEVAALERERGVEVRFVHPTPGFVLRTSQEGSRRCYINVCSNALMGEPRARAERGGQRWELPYSLAPGREELRPAGRRRLLYDVVFHRAALRLAARSAPFRRLLCDTALEAVERHCGVRLDRTNAAVLRGVSYKGVPQAPVIRSPLPGGAPKPPDEGDSPLPPFPFPPAAPPPPAAGGSAPAAPPPPPGPTTPRWSIRHRSYVDLQDYRHCRDSAPSPVPRELVVTVELPLLRSAEQAELEIRGRELRLDSQCPAYRLRLRLPYDVDERGGRAAFSRAQRQLQVTLPVVPPASGGEGLEGAGPAAEGVAEPPAAEAGGGAASPPEPGPGGAATSTWGGGEAADPPAEPPAEPLCDLLGDPAEPPTDPPAEPPADPPAENPPDPTSEPLAEPLADPPAELATDPSSEPPADPPAELPSDPLTEPLTDPLADPLSKLAAYPSPEPPTEPPDPPLPRSGPASPIASPEPAMPTGDTPPQASEGHPGEMATTTCPPFHARQDEASLTLLLLVPGIHPQSLHGAVGAHHYSLRFSTDSAAFALFLHFPPAARLLSPESSVSVSAHNAVVGLAKAPGSTGLWEKFCFGLDASALQERLFVSEENVDGFLGTVLCPSPCSQSALESQALIEVLDVTEDRIQIRVEGPMNYQQFFAKTPSNGEIGEVLFGQHLSRFLLSRGKPQRFLDSLCRLPQAHDREGALGSSGGALAGETSGDYPETKAETNCPAAEERAPGSSPSGPAGTIGKAGCSSHHCSQREPPDTSSAIAGESGRKELDLESAAAAGDAAPAPGSGKQGLPGDREAGDGDEGAPTGSGSRAGSPLLREVNPQDGSVRIVRDHRTRCPVVFQNSLLYELD